MTYAKENESLKGEFLLMKKISNFGFIESY